MLDTLSTRTKWIAGAAAVAVLVLVLLFWFGALTSTWNGIGNWLFDRQINAKRREVQTELDKAAKEREALKQTLVELAQAKEELAKAKQDRINAEAIFNDQSKTAAQKVAAYKDALAVPPVHTDPTGVTTEDLCARAKAANSSQHVIDALCPR